MKTRTVKELLAEVTAAGTLLIDGPDRERAKAGVCYLAACQKIDLSCVETKDGTLMTVRQ